MVLSFEEIYEWCNREHKRLWEYMLEDDICERHTNKEESMQRMEHIFDIMVEAIDSYESTCLSASGLVGGNGAKMEEFYATSNGLSGDYTGEAIVTALKMAESNACMRRIVAAPTAGSCGVIPAALIPYYRREMATKEDIVKALYVSGCIGEVIASRASIAGAQGGCQAEVGAASAMAAGSLVFLKGGTDYQIGEAVAMALKNVLGLVCDPIAGLVEVPCVKRNVLGTVNAISCADMAMAGIVSRIPVDEVIDAMNEVGNKMDSSLKETAMGGLANTKTGIRIAEQLGN